MKRDGFKGLIGIAVGVGALAAVVLVALALASTKWLVQRCQTRTQGS